ncbi:MAG TPA: alpha/beta fold hydrolase [Stellaceae bacterium]|nr:alpha/beta fold hydrolase [Stellaceae bacterium]
MADAVDLAFSEYGAGRPVVILHGLFGAGANWTAVARQLGERFRVFALDLRNHGASPWAPRMDYRSMAADVAAFIAARRLGRAALVGHSMGGKAAMVLALTQPALVERLVVVDIAPVAHPSANADYVEAMRALDLRGVTRRGAADALLRPRIPDDAVRLFLLQNLVPGPDGLRWRLNLGAIAEGMDELAGFPEFPAGTEYAGPVLVVRGERSDYVQERDLPAFRRLFPRSRMVAIPRAGHWVHADRTEDFLAEVVPFLAAS